MGFAGDVRKIKALADENRLAIMLSLRHGEKCACVLLRELNITQPTLSRHMRLLCAIGLVGGRKEGNRMYCSVSPECTAVFLGMIEGCVNAPVTAAAYAAAAMAIWVTES